MNQPMEGARQGRQRIFGAQHGVVCANVAYELKQYLARMPVAVCFGAGTGFLVDEANARVVALDAAVVRRDRITEESISGEVFRGPPDLGIIVVSPHDQFDEVEADVQALLEAGTRYVWILRPRVNMVTVHAAPVQVTVLGATESLSAEDVLPALQLPVRNLFEEISAEEPA